MRWIVIGLLFALAACSGGDGTRYVSDSDPSWALDGGPPGNVLDTAPVNAPIHASDFVREISQ